MNQSTLLRVGDRLEKFGTPLVAEWRPLLLSAIPRLSLTKVPKSHMRDNGQTMIEARSSQIRSGDPVSQLVHLMKGNARPLNLVGFVFSSLLLIGLVVQD